MSSSLRFVISCVDPLGACARGRMRHPARTGAPRRSLCRCRPIRIAAVTSGRDHGRIGVTLCPGKSDPAGISGAWKRDLDTDLDAIQRWGATAVVTLIEEHEFDLLKVRDLPRKVRDRHMEWWHLPIRDGKSPPARGFEDKWAVAGEALRDRLRLGFDVLVHCRGGLGRARTVAARLLVELGARPDRAIRSVRDVRPGAVETRQEAHVAQCSAQTPSVPSHHPDSIRDRALGAFLGLAVGDAVGTTLEFCPRDAQPRLEDMVGGGPFRLPPGAWTDDTAMALALADSLAASRTLDCRDLMDRFVRWWREGDYSCSGHCFDIGNTTRRALERYLKTGGPLTGSPDPGSAGNGSLMRLSPVALRFWHDRPLLVATAAEHSRTTHGAEEAVDACRAFAEMLADAIAGRPRADVLAPRRFEGSPAIARVLAGSWRGPARETIRSSGYVVHWSWPSSAHRLRLSLLSALSARGRPPTGRPRQDGCNGSTTEACASTSMVPRVTKRWTSTLRRGPMRKARSVARCPWASSTSRPRSRHGKRMVFTRRMSVD